MKDEFEITVEASKLISNLKEQGILDIDQKQFFMGAYISILFGKRK